MLLVQRTKLPMVNCAMVWNVNLGTLNRSEKRVATQCTSVLITEQRQNASRKLRRRRTSPNKIGAWRKFCRSTPSKTRLRLSCLYPQIITTMAALPTMRPLGCLRSLLKTQEVFQPQMGRRFLSTAYSQRPQRVPLPQNLPEQFLSQVPTRMRPENGMYCSRKH